MQKILEISYGIKAFNLYITSQVEQLTARGETSSDLLINLFAAYIAVQIKNLSSTSKSRRTSLKGGKDATTKKLMQVSLIKYKDRQRSDKWQALSVNLYKAKATTDKSTRASTMKKTPEKQHFKDSSQNRQVCRQVRMESCRSSERRANYEECWKEDLSLLPASQ
jgi:hypothetical protein